MLVILNYILGYFNFSLFQSDAIDYAMTPFQVYFGFLLWPIIFSWVIGLVYRYTHHLSTTTVAIFITFAFFGHTNQFLQVPQLSSFFFIVAVVSWSACLLTIFVKKRYENN